MKTAGVLTTGLALLANQASAHYIFEYLSINGVENSLYQYVRENTNYNSPVTDLTSDDLRCNVGATGTNTQTITVAAGSAFTFTADIAVYQQGPVSFYMAKAPTTAAAYDGSGQAWFKIKDIGPTFDSSGDATWDLVQSYSGVIPAAVPSGDYLLRIQQLAIHNPWPAGIPQFYDSCAQITVTGGGNGVPGPLVTIPGHISDTDPGYTVNIYSNFHNYTVPGPAVWTGGDVSTPTNPSGNSGTTTTAPSGPTTTSVTTPPTTPVTGGASLYGQCGGQGWTGPTSCASGTCTVSSAYYSQCLP